METNRILKEETGCYLDNHRGHYIVRDAIELAVGFGFIIGPFASFTLSCYDSHHGHLDGYPFESVIELCDDAVDWLNSGQDKCPHCENGRTTVAGLSEETTVICRSCSGTGRGPRVAGQNFPPIIPEGYWWGFNDGDFGLYSEEDEF